MYDASLGRIEDKADCSMRCKQRFDLVRADSVLLDAEYDSLMRENIVASSEVLDRVKLDCNQGRLVTLVNWQGCCKV